VTTTTHKTLRGPRGGLILSKSEYAKPINSAVFPGIQGGPLMHVIAGKAVCFAEALSDDFKSYGRAILENAKALAESLLSQGVRLISGGTDNHLVLLDVTSLGLGGKIAEKTLERCGITVNMNMIPFDTRKAMDPSGIRIGAPALTTRGMRTEQFQQIAKWIVQALRHVDDETLLQRIRGEVREMAMQFPVPAEKVPVVA
jgi:glycine hydroxymethyltransferase